MCGWVSRGVQQALAARRRRCFSMASKEDASRGLVGAVRACGPVPSSSSLLTQLKTSRRNSSPPSSGVVAVVAAGVSTSRSSGVSRAGLYVALDSAAEAADRLSERSLLCGISAGRRVGADSAGIVRAQVGARVGRCGGWRAANAVCCRGLSDWMVVSCEGGYWGFRCARPFFFFS